MEDKQENTYTEIDIEKEQEKKSDNDSKPNSIKPTISDA